MAEIGSNQRFLTRLRVGTIGGTPLERLTIHTALGNAAASRGYRVSSTWTTPATELSPFDERNARLEFNTGIRSYELLSINIEVDLKLAIARIAQIDAALVLIDAVSGPTASAREQALLLRQLTVGAVIVALTDASEVDDDALDLVELEVRELLTTYGFAGDSVPVVRLAAADGETTGFLTSVSVLIEAFDAAIPLPLLDSSAPFLMPVETISLGPETVFTGRIERGSVRVGQQLELVGLRPTRAVMVQSVERSGQILARAVAGETVDLRLVGVGRDDAEPGQVLAAPGSIVPQKVFAAELELTFGEQQRPLWTGTSCEVSFFPAQRVPASIEFAEGMLAAGPQGKPGISIGVQTLAPIAVEPGATFALLARGRQIGRGTVRVIPAAQPGQGKTTRKERALALSGVPGWRVLRRVAARAGSDVFVVGDLARRAISRIRDPLGFESIDPADFVPFATPVQLAYSGPPQAGQSLRTALHQDVQFAELFEWTLDEARRIPGFSPVPSLRLGLPLRATQPLLDPASAETDVLSGVYRFEGSIGTGGSAFSRLHATLRYALTLIDAPRFTKSAPSESDLAHVREFTAQINERELVDVLGTVDTAQRLHRVIVKCWVYSRSTREFIDLLERVGAFGLLQRVCARVEPSIPLPIEARASLVSTPLTRSERPRLPYDTDRWSSAVAAEGGLTRTLRAAGQRLAGGQRVLWMSPDLPIASSPLEYPVRGSELGEFVHIAFAAALDESPVDVLEDAGLAAILLTLPTASDGGGNWQAHPIPSTVSRRLRVLDDGRNGWTWTARCNCLGWLKLSSSARFAIVAERAASTDERRGADA